MRKIGWIILGVAVILFCMLGFKLYSVKLSLDRFKSTYSQAKLDNLPEILNAAQDLQTELSSIAFLLKINPKLYANYEILSKTVAAKDIVLEFLGFREEKTFLVVMQNNTELRPSGGFWGAYGILKIKRGEIVSLKTADSYLLDKANIGKFTPPEEAAEFFDEEWRFWNANWSPDFTNSARQGLFFFHEADPTQKFDGVIGPNVDYFLEILKLTGPLEVSGHTFKVDETNFIQKMIYEPLDPAVRETKKDDPNFIGKLEEKKPLLGDLAINCWTKIRQQKEFHTFAQITYKALQNKDLILFSETPTLEVQLHQIGWDGTVPQGGNFAMIVDANIGSKLDFFIEKQAQIKTIAPRRYEIKLTYRNTLKDRNSRENQLFVVYRSLVRVFIPEDANMIDSSGGQTKATLSRDNENRKFMKNLVILEPGESQTITFTWEAPYNLPLEIIKQAGSHMVISQS